MLDAGDEVEAEAGALPPDAPDEDGLPPGCQAARSCCSMGLAVLLKLSAESETMPASN